MTPRPYEDAEFAALNERITALYQALNDLAIDLAERAEADPAEETRTFLDNLEWRMPLEEVRACLLDARHDVHGALTALVKYAGRVPTRRPSDGDPDAPPEAPEEAPGPDDPARERAPTVD